MFRVLSAVACLAVCACAPESRPDIAAADAAPATLAEPVVPDVVAADADVLWANTPTLTKHAEAGSVKVTSPTVGERVSSPIVIEGTAINTFFFEGVFPVELVANGVVIARAQAQQSGDKNWTYPGPVDFKAELVFDVATVTDAELVLSEDMPAPISPDSDVAGPASAMKLPVILNPTPQ